MKRTFAGIALGLLSSFSVNAQEETSNNSSEDFPDRFAVKIGAFHVYDRDTEVSANTGSGIIGTTIDFEDDLGEEEESDSARVRGYYRFDPHHRIDYSWYRVDRDGDKTADRDLNFGDAVFPSSVGVESSLTVDIAKLAYTYSFYHVDKVELGFGIGAYWMSYDIELNNPERTLIADESVSTPLPVWGLRMDYTINPRWHALFDYEMFYIEWNDEIRGSLDDLQLAFEYRAWRNVSFGAGINRLGVDVDVEQDEFDGRVTDLMRGYQFYVGLHY